MIDRPTVPTELREPGWRFEPAPELLAFLRAAFIDEGAPFYRDEYEHLREARLGVLWTNVERVKDGLLTLGMAQLYRNSGDRWTSGRSYQQVMEWFVDWWPEELEPEPHFILTFYAPYVAAANDPSACALFSHELRHCGQKIGQWGEPKFNQVTGEPEFAMVGHDVSEFVSVVQDFGIEAAGPGAVAMVAAAKKAPRFGAAHVAGVCGCGAKLQAAA